MAKRIHKLNRVGQGNVASDMYLVIDQLETGGGGTYASEIKHVIGSVIGKGASGTAGGDSLTQVASTGEIVLKPAINIPAKDAYEGGQVNLFFNDGTHAYVDTFTDVTGGYNQNGVSLGKNEKYMRLVCETNITNDQKHKWASGLLMRISDGKLYMPVSAATPTNLVPITVGGSDYDDQSLRDEIAKLKNQITNLTNQQQLCHVGANPPGGVLVSGKLWWDTDNATMYVYDGAAWVVSSPADASDASGGFQIDNVNHVITQSTSYENVGERSNNTSAPMAVYISISASKNRTGKIELYDASAGVYKLIHTTVKSGGAGYGVYHYCSFFVPAGGKYKLSGYGSAVLLTETTFK